MPSAATTGSDYLVNKLLVYKGIVTSGETTAVDAAGDLLIDSAATFTTDGIFAETLSG